MEYQGIENCIKCYHEKDLDALSASLLNKETCIEFNRWTKDYVRDIENQSNLSWHNRVSKFLLKKIEEYEKCTHSKEADSSTGKRTLKIEHLFTQVIYVEDKPHHLAEIQKNIKRLESNIIATLDDISIWAKDFSESLILENFNQLEMLLSAPSFSHEWKKALITNRQELLELFNFSSSSQSELEKKMNEINKLSRNSIIYVRSFYEFIYLLGTINKYKESIKEFALKELMQKIKSNFDDLIGLCLEKQIYFKMKSICDFITGLLQI